jgi:hypothetical protein
MADVLGFCLGSDRYYAVRSIPTKGAESDVWDILDVLGNKVSDVAVSGELSGLEQIASIRVETEKKLGSKFDLIDADRLNLDLRISDEERALRVHVTGVHSVKERFVMDLSDGSNFPWENAHFEIPDLRGSVAPPWVQKTF